MHDIIATAAICSIVYLAYIMFLKNSFDNQISIEQEKAITFYLDRQLITRIVSRLNDVNPLENIINDITRYFRLDKIVIFKIPTSDHKAKEPLANEIYTYIQSNLEYIKEYLSNNKFLTIHMTKQSNESLVQYLCTHKKYFIVYTASIENIMNQNDIDLITEAVTPIILLGFINSGNDGPNNTSYRVSAN